MGLSFVCWATRSFDGERFRSVRQDHQLHSAQPAVVPAAGAGGYRLCLRGQSFQKLSWYISYRGRSNTFYLFGGKDESSQSLIQGVTLAGVLMDEAALMPRSFVEQACARCSVPAASYGSTATRRGRPLVLFRVDKKAGEKRALYLHFGLEDNPALSREVIARYRGMFSGVFYRRFILGEWVAAEGRVYDFFDETMLQSPPPEDCEKFAMSCDYGTANPFSLGLWGLKGGVWYRLREFYYDSRREGRQKTDAEYVGIW
jgi:hypothetical protein